MPAKEENKREAGHYWVKWFDSYSMVYWTGDRWFTINSTDPLKDNDFEEINENRILEPDETDNQKEVAVAFSNWFYDCEPIGRIKGTADYFDYWYTNIYNKKG